MYAFVDSALKEIGARESCSENERRLGQRLADLWRGLGLTVTTETFECHPKAFLGFIPFAVLLDLGAVIAYWFSPFLCFLLALLGSAIMFFELVRYREFVDPLFPKETGTNVIAVLPPRGETKRRVVVSAHQDSAYEFIVWYMLKNAAVPIMLIGFVALPITMLAGLLKFAAGGDGAFFNWLGYLCLALYPFAGLNFFFHAYWAVPGASDDLAGLSVLVGLSKALTERETPGLENTELILLAASSEEAGLRGAKRYVERHLDELRQLPTHGIFVDSIYDENFLTILTSELFTGARHDPRLIRLAKDAAAKRNQPILDTMLTVGGTDGSAFSAAGLSAVTIIAQDSTRLVPNYHTRLDVIDYVRPESLSAVMQLAYDMIERIDEGALEK